LTNPGSGNDILFECLSFFNNFEALANWWKILLLISSSIMVLFLSAERKGGQQIVFVGKLHPTEKKNFFQFCHVTKQNIVTYTIHQVILLLHVGAKWPILKPSQLNVIECPLCFIPCVFLTFNKIPKLQKVLYQKVCRVTHAILPILRYDSPAIDFMVDMGNVYPKN
jgi:hypothetical protein